MKYAMCVLKKSCNGILEITEKIFLFFKKTMLGQCFLKINVKSGVYFYVKSQNRYFLGHSQKIM